jgi:alkylation response protein AidB-like acyl-CoA dehydrogenase
MSLQLRRDPIGVGVALLNKLARSRAIDRFGLRKPAERAVFEATKTGFRTAGAVSRGFSAASKLAAPSRLPAARGTGRFDLTPTEDQQQMVEVVRSFAADVLRPAAAAADTACATDPKVLESSSELGLSLIEVPEELGGIVTERSAMTGVLVAEALAHGDMGQAVACLAPSAVSTAISLWGDEVQQATYLPSFTGSSSVTGSSSSTGASSVIGSSSLASSVPPAALALLEPRALLDPFALRTRYTGGLLNGVKSLVPRAAEAELFVIGAQTDAGPRLFLVEPDHPGVTIEAEPSMGLRAASLGRVILTDVPATPLGSVDNYTECVRLSRLGWCALSLGTARAVLDYVTPYVNSREAFGEPISHRQSVAFMVANIAIELEGMKLVTYRAGSRAEQGLPFDREVALARRLCTEKGMQIGTDGVQLLGGHGFVKEHPVERWYRDLRAIGIMEGVVLV